MNQEKIGSFIKKIRKDNHLSQQAFAEKLGVSFQAVSKWENGKNLPDLSTMQEIKKQFNVDIDEIIEGKEKQKNKSKTITIDILIGILIISIMIIFFHFMNKSNIFEFQEVNSTNENFKVSGSVVRTSDRTSLIINDVTYQGTEDDIEYESLECNLMEEKESSVNEITSCEVGKNMTLTEYLENLKIKMDHHAPNCTMFTESKMYIELKAIKEDKTITYKIPIEVENASCD